MHSLSFSKIWVTLYELGLSIVVLAFYAVAVGIILLFLFFATYFIFIDTGCDVAIEFETHGSCR